MLKGVQIREESDMPRLELEKRSRCFAVAEVAFAQVERAAKQEAQASRALFGKGRSGKNNMVSLIRSGILGGFPT